MKLDILVLAAHPDDAELGCGGTIAAHAAQGYKVGIVDLTQGELGTRGTVDTRRAEATASAHILGIAHRENLGMPDGFFQNTREFQLAIIRAIRQYQPRIVLANAISDRHIDHGRAAQLANDACFLAGLRKIETHDPHGNLQVAWRPHALYHYIQDRFIAPQIVMDITPYWTQKMEAVRAFKTQFFSDEYDNSEPVTPISTPDFIYFLEARAREMGRMIGTTFGEGFTKATPIGTQDLLSLG